MHSVLVTKITYEALGSVICWECVALQSFVCGEMSSLVGSFFFQSCLKYFLTEG